MRRIVAIGLLLILMLVTPAFACLWDRDTLAAEAKGLPGLIEVVVGRIERNPPLFYEMRLERVAEQIKNDATQLALYDDAAVAADRLGRQDEAIAWMERKAAAMQQGTHGSAELKEHHYRYLANLGTFYAHRWLRNGANAEDAGDLKQARDLIAHAIELNPDAHFGREKVQLVAIEWLLKPPVYKEEVLPIGWRYDGSKVERVLPRDELVEGMTGMMVLGAAWESLNVLDSLVAQVPEDASLRRMIENRITELEEAGAQRLRPAYSQTMFLGQGYSELQEWPAAVADEYYHEARAAADRWHERRTQYIVERLKKGLHSDTHAGFWTDFDDEPTHPAPPNTTGTWAGGMVADAGSAITLLIALSVPSIAIAVVVWLIVRGLRRRSAATLAATTAVPAAVQHQST